jgi:hypothetical protein
LQVLRIAFPLNGRHTPHPGILRCGLSIPSLASLEYWVARRRTLKNLTKKTFSGKAEFLPRNSDHLSGITGRGIALASGATADVNYSSTDFGAVPATQRGAR